MDKWDTRAKEPAIGKAKKEGGKRDIEGGERERERDGKQEAGRFVMRERGEVGPKATIN